MHYLLSGNKRVCSKASDTNCQITFSRVNCKKGMWRVWVRKRGCIRSWWGNQRESDHWGDLGVDGWIILGWICRRRDVDIWTGLGWPRIDTGGGRL